MTDFGIDIPYTVFTEIEFINFRGVLIVVGGRYGMKVYLDVLLLS